MPSVSKKQHNLMAAAAHDPAFAKKVGVPAKVAKEYVAADKGKKFSGGGKTMAKKEMMHDDIVEDKKMIKKAVGMHDKQLHGGKKTDLAGLKKGGCATKKMASGGSASKRADGIATKGKTKGTMVKMCGGGMKKGK